MSASERQLKPEPPGTLWHPLAPSGTNWRQLAPTGANWRPLAPPGAYACAPRRGATPVSASERQLVIKDPHAQDIAAQGGPRRPCSRGQSDHLSSILGSLSARNRSTRNACTEDRRHWSPLVASERPCAPIEARTSWHLLAPFGTDGRSWALMGAHGRPLERMSAYRAPAPLVASGRQWS